MSENYRGTFELERTEKPKRSGFEFGFLNHSNLYLGNRRDGDYLILTLSYTDNSGNMTLSMAEKVKGYDLKFLDEKRVKLETTYKLVGSPLWISFGNKSPIRPEIRTSLFVPPNIDIVRGALLKPKNRLLSR